MGISVEKHEYWVERYEGEDMSSAGAGESAESFRIFIEPKLDTLTTPYSPYNTSIVLFMVDHSSTMSKRIIFVNMHLMNPLNVYYAPCGLKTAPFFN